jgi:hypothetical protein
MLTTKLTEGETSKPDNEALERNRLSQMCTEISGIILQREHMRLQVQHASAGYLLSHLPRTASHENIWNLISRPGTENCSRLHLRTELRMRMQLKTIHHPSNFQVTRSGTSAFGRICSSRVQISVNWVIALPESVRRRCLIHLASTGTSLTNSIYLVQ